ncbi:MAG: enediyne biosynthesis protein, partial [Abditibacteriota bacterium]|nr:enediyne biosynthesis protein [Abditibacteriota bacterium]
NNGNGTFTDVAVEAGCAYGEEGKVMAAMGITSADYDRSGRESLYVTNFSGRPNILFKNLGGGLYEDNTELVGLGLSHLGLLSFGCEFLDYDADGWNDLITNNGHVQMDTEHRGGEIPYRQPKQLLRNEGGKFFREIAEPALLGDLAHPTVGRGLATGDFNNDGSLDVLAVGQNAPVQLFENKRRNSHHWVSFKTIGTRSNRSGLHTRIRLRAAGARQLATVRAGSSYLSASDRRVYFGLGAARVIEEVVVEWPSGAREVLRNLPVDTFYTLTEKKCITKKSSAEK